MGVPFLENTYLTKQEPVMKKAVVAAVLLALTPCSGLFTETADCRQSLELGGSDAKVKHRTRGWYLLGVVSCPLGSAAGLFTQTEACRTAYEN